MIVTIDGPAGAGKSSVSRQLAARLGFHYLDTGAMYRALTWWVLEQGRDPGDRKGVAELARQIDISFAGDRVLVAGQDVSQAIRSPQVTGAVSEVADNPDVRQVMVSRQRDLARSGDYVCEGRDQGTVAFPQADCKIFLTASAAERAQRRCRQLVEQGESADLEEVLAAQNKRDLRDESRPVGKLVKAVGSIEVLTDGMDFPQVVDHLEAIVVKELGL
ncbi:MAG: (d)CMP kinase [Mariniblastus sp.]|nr:(d)CMP kinase [Mariniblastus sp.]